MDIDGGRSDDSVGKRDSYEEENEKNGCEVDESAETAVEVRIGHCETETMVDHGG